MHHSLAIMIVSLLLGCATQETHETQEPFAEPSGQAPTPELSPEEVVRIQMDGFRTNDADDSGIEIAYRFASPANKQVTGPIQRFSRMMRNPAYAPMLEAHEVRISEATIRGSLARVFVTVIAVEGGRADYAFFLSRQKRGEYVDCWMTEGVTVLDVEDLSGSATVI